MKKIFSISILCFLLLNSSILAQNKKPTKKLPNKEFTKFFGDMMCKCLEPSFTGFSPEFVKIWNKIGEDFRTKKKTDLTAYFEITKNNKSGDSLRYEKLSERANKQDCEDNSDTIDDWEDKYDFDADKDFKIYLARNFNDIMDYLKKEKKCPILISFGHFITSN